MANAIYGILLLLQLPLLHDNRNTITDSDEVLAIHYDLLDSSNHNISFEKIVSDSTLKYYRIPDSRKIATPQKQYWLRFRLKNNTNKSYLIYGLTNYDGCVYIPLQDGKYSKVLIDKRSYFWQRVFFSNSYLVALPYSQAEQTYYVNLSSHLFTGLGFRIATYKYLFNKSTFNFIFYTAYLTIIAFVLLFSIVLLIRLKDRIYLLYMLYLLMLLVYCLCSWTFLNPLLGIYINNFFTETLPFAFITFFLLLYSREFLNTKKEYPLLDTIIKICAGSRLLILAVGIILKIEPLHNVMVDSILLLPSFIGGVIAFRAGTKHIRYYLLSFTILYLGIVLHTEMVVSYLYPLDFISKAIRLYFDETGMFFYIFSTIEVLLFTLSLTDRIIVLQENKELEQVKTIELQNENLLLKEAYNLHLEEVVEQRTIEIKQANVKLLEQERQINRLLQEDNEKLNLDLEMLQKVRVMKMNVDFKEFTQTFENDDACLSFLSELKWKNGFECRKCKFKRYSNINIPFVRKCKLCKYEESATAYTLFNNIKFPIQKALYLAYAGYTFKDLNVNKISEELELRTATCYAFVKKIHETIDTKTSLKLKTENWTGLLV